MLHILGNFTYALLTYMGISAMVYFLHGISRERVKSKDPDAYSNIVGNDSWLFDKGGGSPADIAAYFRFFRYVVTSRSRAVIGKKFWIFYRLIVPIYIVSILWLFLSLGISMVMA